MERNSLILVVLLILLAVLGHTVWHSEMVQLLNFVTKIMTGNK